MQARRMWIALAALLALGFASCGNDDDGGSAETTAAPPTETTPTETTAAATGGGGGTLKIGYALDLGELGAFSENPASAAAKYVVDQINAAGGANGTTVELVVEQINGEAEVTQQGVQKLLDAGVQAILGPPFSDLGFPLLTQVAGKVPVIFVSSTEVTLADAAKNAFLAAFSDPAQAAAAAEYALDEGYKNAVTFSSPDAPYFTINPDVFKKRFEAGGAKVAKDFTYSLADTDFSTQVNELANLDPKPDVVYTAMVMPQTGTLLGQLKGAGVEVALMGADGLDATNVAAAGADAEGVVYTGHSFPEAGGALEKFLADFKAATGRDIETISFGALASDSVNLIVDAFKRAGSPDPAKIAEALKATEGFAGLTGTITYKGTNGVPNKPVFLIKIEGGKPTLIKSFVPTQVPAP